MKTKREIDDNNRVTLLLIDMQRVTLAYCVKSPKWVLSVVKDARKELLRLLKPPKPPKRRSRRLPCPHCESPDPENAHVSKCPALRDE